MRTIATIAVCAATLSSVTIAQTEREHGSHEHGSAALNIALDGDHVLIELETPWNNLVGFEHAPRTEEQKTLVADALSLLEQPVKLFTFSGSDCEVDDVMLDNRMADADGDDHDDEHGHDDDHDKEEHDEHHDDHDKEEHDEHHDDHDKEHDEHHDDHDKEHDEHHGDDHAEKHEDEHHDDHDDDHADHDDDEGTHSEVLASYNFHCDDPSGLSSIDVVFLERWSGFVELDVQLIGPGGQDLVELNADQLRVDLKKVK